MEVITTAPCVCAHRHSGPTRHTMDPDSPGVHAETDQLIANGAGSYEPLDALPSGAPPTAPFCTRLRGRVSLLVGLLVRLRSPVSSCAAGLLTRLCASTDLPERFVLHPRVLLRAAAAALGHRVLFDDARGRGRKCGQPGRGPRDPWSRDWRGAGLDAVRR